MFLSIYIYIYNNNNININKIINQNKIIKIAEVTLQTFFNIIILNI